MVSASNLLPSIHPPTGIRVSSLLNANLIVSQPCLKPSEAPTASGQTLSCYALPKSCQLLGLIYYQVLTQTPRSCHLHLSLPYHQACFSLFLVHPWPHPCKNWTQIFHEHLEKQLGIFGIQFPISGGEMMPRYKTGHCSTLTRPWRPWLLCLPSRHIKT